MERATPQEDTTMNYIQEQDRKNYWYELHWNNEHFVQRYMDHTPENPYIFKGPYQQDCAVEYLKHNISVHLQ
jgi:hypothetical protein